MDKQSDKQTGLGSSLLVRRTEPPQEMAETANPKPRVSLEPVREEQSDAVDPRVIQTPKRPDVQTSEKSQPQGVRDRCTLYLSPDVNQRLHITARLEEKERSDVVNELLRQNLPKFEVIHK